MSQTDQELRDILTATQCVAVVGASMNPLRASFAVARYLQLRGKRVIPINPGHAGETLLGETVYASLADIPADIQVDMVDIFRRSEHILPIVEDALAQLPHLRTIWLQLEIMNEEAAALARAKGINFVQNRCPKIEFSRLFGGLKVSGDQTGDETHKA